MWESGEFITSVAKEETTFQWRIKNLSKIKVTADILNPTMEFEAGESIGSPSKWKLEIWLVDDDGVNLAIQLHSVEFGRVLRPENVKCEAKIKSRINPAKDFSSMVTTSYPHYLVYLHLLKSHALLIDDELVIHFKFELSVDNLDHDSTTRQMMEHSRTDLSTDLGSLLESGVNSDFVIQVKNPDGNVTQMKVHKSILGARSPVFQKMLESPMAESASGSMIIEDLSPECVHLMIKWIYTGVLDKDWKNVPDEMVVAADKYDLKNLGRFLDKYLHLACTLGNALGLRKVARLHGLGMATKNVNKFVKANVEGLLD